MPKPKLVLSVEPGPYEKIENNSAPIFSAPTSKTANTRVRRSQLCPRARRCNATSAKPAPITIDVPPQQRARTTNCVRCGTLVSQSVGYAVSAHDITRSILMLPAAHAAIAARRMLAARSTNRVSPKSGVSVRRCPIPGSSPATTTRSFAKDPGSLSLPTCSTEPVNSQFPSRKTVAGDAVCEDPPGSSAPRLVEWSRPVCATR